MDTCVVGVKKIDLMNPQRRKDFCRYPKAVATKIDATKSGIPKTVLDKIRPDKIRFQTKAVIVQKPFCTKSVLTKSGSRQNPDLDKIRIRTKSDLRQNPFLDKIRSRTKSDLRQNPI